jgi:hypothetical protein
MKTINLTKTFPVLDYKIHPSTALDKVVGDIAIVSYDIETMRRDIDVRREYNDQFFAAVLFQHHPDIDNDELFQENEDFQDYVLDEMIDQNEELLIIRKSLEVKHGECLHEMMEFMFQSTQMRYQCNLANIYKTNKLAKDVIDHIMSYI